MHIILTFLSIERLGQLTSLAALYGQQRYMVGSHAGWHSSKGLTRLTRFCTKRESLLFLATWKMMVFLGSDEQRISR